MTRDYITYVIQRAQGQDLIKKLRMQEQEVENAKKLNDKQGQRNAENVIEQLRKELLREAQSPLALSGWQSLREDVRSYYKKYFESPRVDDLSILPAYSFALKFTFTLAQPYISRDEQNFYIIDNPVRKDKVFGLPYVAPTSWKGSLRAAFWQLKYGPKDKVIYRLFGNEKGEKDEEKLHQGRLHFFPTFFPQKGLEIINPQNREQRTGGIPIPFESVPIDAAGIFTLLYVPFDRIGEDDKETRKQVAADLKIVAKGLQAMFRTYGFGAKTSSGFGLAREDVGEGILTIRADYSPEPFKSFARLVKVGEELAAQLESASEEGQND